ncbi:MAG: hypothetical protein R3F37_08965 [Candidatus Competibacteraceae bacterium]
MDNDRRALSPALPVVKSLEMASPGLTGLRGFFLDMLQRDAERRVAVRRQRCRQTFRTAPPVE